jgi:Fic family protein
MKSSGRAGQYVLQPTGYRAFIPGPIPPVPPIAMDDEMWSLLSAADRALGRLDGSTETLPDPDLFVVMYVRKEAVLSSQIEGTQATLMDVLEFEAKALEPDRPQDADEVINYVNAMNYGLSRLKKLPVSSRLFREIHGKLMTGVRGSRKTPGEFRRSQNWVGPPGSSIETATFVPPPVPEMHDALSQLEKFIHDRSPMPVLVKVGIVHSQFETIHPFLDGNGRVGRLLITLLLCEREILKRPLLYLSGYFKQNQAEYYHRLGTVQVDGDWEGWLKFFLRGVAEVSNEATTTSRKIVSLREEHRKLIVDRTHASHKALMLLERLFFSPMVSVTTVQSFTGLSFANANELVKRFVEMRLLREVTGKPRNRLFAYDPYLDLFRERAVRHRLAR